VEHGFGHGTQQSQYRVKSHSQYAKQKSGNNRDFIRKCCKNHFSYHLSERKQYQHPEKYDIYSEDVFAAMNEINKGRKKVTHTMTEDRKRDKLILKEVIDNHKPLPTKSV